MQKEKAEKTSCTSRRELVTQNWNRFSQKSGKKLDQKVLRHVAAMLSHCLVGTDKLLAHQTFAHVSFVVGYFPDFFSFNYSCLMISGLGVVGNFPTLQCN